MSNGFEDKSPEPTSHVACLLRAQDIFESSLKGKQDTIDALRLQIQTLLDRLAFINMTFGLVEVSGLAKLTLEEIKE